MISRTHFYYTIRNKVFLLWICTFFSCISVFAQDKDNRAYIGLYGYYDTPLFQFKKSNYESGHGFSLGYISRKFTPFKNEDISLRLGASFGISQQGYKKLKINYTDPLNSTGYQEINNTYHAINLLGRFTYEKHKVGKPFIDIFAGSGNFSSQLSYLSLTKEYKDGKDISMNVFNYGLSLGYLLNPGDIIMIESKVSIIQGHDKVSFINVNTLSHNGKSYDYEITRAVPTILCFQVGLLIRIPKITGTCSSGSHSTPDNNRTPERIDYNKPNRPSENLENLPGNRNQERPDNRGTSPNRGGRTKF